MCGGSLRVQSAFEMHCAAMFPHRAVSGPSGVMHRHTHTGQCHLGAASSCMAFYFRPSLFLSTTSKVKYCPYILLTTRKKKYRSGQNQKRWERETWADCRAGATPAVWCLSNVGTWGWALYWPLKRHRDSWKSDRLQISEKESFYVCVYANYCTYKELCE